MLENLTLLGVDLGGPTLVAYAVIASCAALLGVALGSFLESRRSRRLARPSLYNGPSRDLVTADLVTADGPAPPPNGLQDAPTGYDSPSVDAGYDQPGMGWAAPLVAFSEPGAPKPRPAGRGLVEMFTEPGLEGWYSSESKRGARLKLAGLVVLATVSVAGSIGAGILLLQP